ncbi:MAG: GNAT family N-acetyltransferase [Candidatus Thiodiazotropha sp. (ex Monitilora ramsayi)]|nr:GNAT family N-acetyltransferase [Candidatus Thiodiazotropha sp. (ex Monitilora ramsayi)]
MNIRQATATDIDAMSLLLDQLFTIEQDFSPDREKQRRGLQLLIDSPGALVVVAEEGDEIAGMATLQLVVSTAEGGRSGVIEDVVVSEPYRGGGIGHKLMDHLLSWAESQGATRMQLLADRDNQPALDFYQKQGWSLTRLVALRKSFS